MKFKFIEHRDFTAFGIEFPAGEFVEVTDPAIVRKLQGNSHFVSGPEKSVEPKAVEKAEPAKVVAIGGPTKTFTSVQDVAIEPSPAQKRRARKAKG